MKALRSLSSARADSPTSASSKRRSSSRNPSDASASASATAASSRPSSSPAAFAFTQINVASFDRSEAFFEKVFGWRFIGEPTSPAFVLPAAAAYVLNSGSGAGTGGGGGGGGGGGANVKVAPPIAPPPDHRVNYFTPRREVGQGHIAGGLFKFGPGSVAGNFGGRLKRRLKREERERRMGTEMGQGKGVGGDEDMDKNKNGSGAGEEQTDESETDTEIPDVINYVAVEDITIALNAVRLAGGRTVVPPWMERDEMARFALFEDTEGNVFGLIQYLM